MKTKLLLILSLIALPIATSIAMSDRNVTKVDRPAIQNKIDNLADSIKDNPVLTAKVKAKLEADPILKNYMTTYKTISVKSYMSGLVKLSGTVEKYTEKVRATTVTKEVEGVTDITNNILVRSRVS